MPPLCILHAMACSVLLSCWLGSGGLAPCLPFCFAMHCQIRSVAKQPFLSCCPALPTLHPFSLSGPAAASQPLLPVSPASLSCHRTRCLPAGIPVSIQASWGWAAAGATAPRAKVWCAWQPRWRHIPSGVAVKERALYPFLSCPCSHTACACSVACSKARS